MNIPDPLQKMTPLQMLSSVGGVLFIGFFLIVFGGRSVSQEKSSNMWEISFVEPEKLESLDFSVYQRGKKQTFTYEIFCGRKVVFQGEIAVDFDKKIFVNIEEEKNFSECDSDLRTVEVKNSSGEKRSIYRSVDDRIN
ncbi:MAG: hypothetical protein IPN70_01030 [Candidatus Moraniibacteriota bacterium]|nr:MAG: hypothetical protein IPN70_01030 [Candidatus Moranbacteria bacterium]